MRDTHPRLGVVCLVVINEGDGQLILGRRARGGNEGKWIIPGGGVELGETWRAAGEREFAEETGMRVKIDPDDPPITVMEIIGGDSHRVCLVATARALDPASALRPSPELSEVRGFTVAELPDVDLSPPVRQTLARLGFIPET